MVEIASIKYIAEGALLTLSYAGLSLFFGLILGSMIAVLSMTGGRVVKFIFDFYISFFRGTPLLVQLVLCYWGLPSVTGVDISPFFAGILVFSLNSSAYVSQIIKAGINSIDSGQFEAGYALNLSKFDVMMKIILPQTFKNMLPALVNEMIDLIKESSLISIIGQSDIMMRAQNVAVQDSNYMAPLVVAAMCYYVLVMFFTYVVKKLQERHYGAE